MVKRRQNRDFGMFFTGHLVSRMAPEQHPYQTANWEESELRVTKRCEMGQIGMFSALPAC